MYIRGVITLAILFSIKIPENIGLKIAIICTNLTIPASEKTIPGFRAEYHISRPARNKSEHLVALHSLKPPQLEDSKNYPQQILYMEKIGHVSKSLLQKIISGTLK